MRDSWKRYGCFTPDFLMVFCCLVVADVCWGEQKENTLPSWIHSIDSRVHTNTGFDTGGEWRVIFDEDVSWALSRQHTDDILDNIEAAGFNVYVPCVWHGRGTYYPSSVVHQDKRVTKRLKSGEDPLAYLVSEAHKRGIEVHPWFTVVRREDFTLPREYWRGAPKQAFNIHNEDYRKFINEVMLDLVRRYKVDGVNLDYVRSMGYCDSEACESAFSATYSAKFSVDVFKAKHTNERVNSIIDWNGRSMDKILSEFSRKARVIRPELIISIDGMPGTRDFEMQGHDSAKWVKNGWIDVIYFMRYEYDFDPQWIDKAVKEAGRKGTVVPLISVFDLDSLEARSPEVLAASIRASRKVWPGLAFYHYKQLTPLQIERLGHYEYSKKVSPKWP